MSAAPALTGKGRPSAYLTCTRCGHTKAAHAFALIALDAREVSEYAATLDPSHTRRDDVCRACRGDEKRAQNRDRVSTEAGMTITQINKAKASALTIVPSPTSDAQKHDRASDTPPAPQAEVVPPAPAPAAETADFDEWLASETPGAFRHNTIMVMRDPHYPGNYWLYARPSGFAPGTQIPQALIGYLTRLLANKPQGEPLKGYVYA